ncbi:MAG: hypothetical protein PVG50_01540, partial [Thiohalophilus sp.]
VCMTHACARPCVEMIARLEGEQWTKQCMNNIPGNLCRRVMRQDPVHISHKDYCFPAAHAA